MLSEVLLYGEINSYSSSEAINLINASGTEDITLRINTPGGNPEYGWGLIAKFIELSGKKTVKVDGKAYSMGAFFLCYCEESEGLDVSQYLIHRAAYPEWIENNPDYFTDAIRQNLANINASLQKAFANKVDVAAFEEIAGCTLKEVFSMDGRKDVFLTAPQAKKIGLIDKIITITPKKKQEIEAYMLDAAAKYTGEFKPEVKKVENIEIQKPKKMTKAELKAAHPALYAEIFEEGVTAGTTQEKDRVEACMVYLAIDPDGVKAAIESGKPLSAKAMAEFSLKQNSTKEVTAIEKENAEEVETEKEKKNLTSGEAKKKEISAFVKEAVSLVSYE